MNLRDLISSAELALPVTRTNDDFESFVEGLFSKYMEKLNLADPSSVIDEVRGHMPEIEAFCDDAKLAIRFAFSGQPSVAFGHFERAITRFTDAVQNFALTQLGVGDLGILYRVRQQSSLLMHREDLFHIPFEKRHLVSTQRYSIPGLPCLYLSGSIYTCWAEMGRPPFHELQAAAAWLRNGETIKILNFSNRPARLLLLIPHEGGEIQDPGTRAMIVKHLVLWPLIAMCSVIVRHRNSPFKPEYLFPQMVLQWITNRHDFDGVCYFSTNVDAVTTTQVLPPCNLVLPAKTVRPSGRCSRLRQLIKMTCPHPWQLLRAVQAGNGMPGNAVPNFDFDFIEGYREPYASTEFGIVQSKLNRLALDIMHRNLNGEPDLGDVAE